MGRRSSLLSSNVSSPWTFLHEQARPVSPRNRWHVDNGAYSDRNLRLALRFLAGPVLSRRPAAEAAASLLCRAVRDHRAQRRVLPHADAGSGESVARTDRQRLRLRLEGIQVHHALETSV